MISFDEFLGGLSPMQQACMRGYFNAVSNNDDPNRARPREAWQALLEAELSRPTT